MNSTFLSTLLFCAFCVSYSSGLFSKVQSTAVKGILTCNGVPARNVRLELWDLDRTDPNDLMAKDTPESDGRFLIEGSEKEFTAIDPQLRIFHKCSNSDSRCYKKASLDIPDSFISEGKIPNKVFDAGRIDLGSISSEDTKDCN